SAAPRWKIVTSTGSVPAARGAKPRRHHERRHADDGGLDELSAGERHCRVLSAQWVRNSGLDRSSAAAWRTRIVGFGSGSTSRKPIAAPRVSADMGARNREAPSPSMTSADVPPDTGYVKLKPYEPRLVASASLKRFTAVPGENQ